MSDFVGRHYFTFHNAVLLSADKSKMLRCDWLANVNSVDSEWKHDKIVDLIHYYESMERLWLPSSVDYRDKDKKRSKEAEIATKLQKRVSICNEIKCILPRHITTVARTGRRRCKQTSSDEDLW